MPALALIDPIPGDAAAEAFLSPARWSLPADQSVAASGYRVEEYRVSGRARLYEDGTRRPPRCVEPAAAYATRALVIRPADDEHFSGVVHIELINPSTGVDWPMYWPDAGRHIRRRGDVYVGVTCKRVTVDALRRISERRYGDLGMDHDGVVWDLLGALAAACRRPQAGGLLPGLRRPDRILLTGWSQSGSFLRTYLSEGLHDLHSTEMGCEVCDAYLIGVSCGGFGPYGYINVDRDGETEFDMDLLRPLTPLTQIPMDDSRRVVRGSRVPVLEYMSEEEAITSVWHQRMDSDAPGDLYRCYQIPGRGHEPGLLDEHARAADHRVAAYDLEAESVVPPRHAASAFLIAAAIDNLVAWTDGTPPPRADPIALNVEHGTSRDPEGIDYHGVSSVKDADGHAVGGVRYLEIDLPVRRMYLGPDAPLAMGQWIHEPFGPEELRCRYGSPADLRERAREIVARLVAGRWYLPEDAAEAVGDFCRALPGDWGEE